MKVVPRALDWSRERCRGYKCAVGLDVAPSVFLRGRVCLPARVFCLFGIWQCVFGKHALLRSAGSHSKSWYGKLSSNVPINSPLLNHKKNEFKTKLKSFLKLNLLG